MARTLATAAVAFALGAGCGNGPTPTVQPLPAADDRPALLAPGPHSPRIASYQIDVAFDPPAHRINGRATLTWRNTGASEVRVLPFHLYMNAFKNEDTLFMRESRGEHRNARASAGGFGWIDIESVSIDGGPDVLETARFPGPDETVIELPLARPVTPGGTVTVDFSLAVTLPEVFARTGYKGAFAMVGQWFPKIGVRAGPLGQETWHCEPFHANSEFFADFGTYDVSLTVPSTHVVAATGVLERARENGDGTRTLTFRAEDVVDFAWMADPYVELLSGLARTALGEVEVRVYHRPEQRAFARRHLRAGIGAIEEFSRLFVPYPWPVMSIVDPPINAADGAGGMEYPTLVTTAGDWVLARPGVRYPEMVTIHEIGHNWFQGLLASNEVQEAWLDEGVNDWADGLVMAALYGEEASFLDWRDFAADFYEVLYAWRGKVPVSAIATPSHQFLSWEDYTEATYVRCALALRTLENIVGRDRFRAAVRAYARRYAWRHPTGRDLFRTLEAELGEDLDWYVEPVFYGRGSVDFVVRAIDCRRARAPRGVFGAGAERRVVTEESATDGDAWVCDVLVANAGNVPAPAEVELRLEDGTRLRRSWRDRTLAQRIRVEAESPVAEAVIDPDREVLLDDNLVNNGLRRIPDTSASRRAAARGQFWTQTLMQVTGL